MGRVSGGTLTVLIVGVLTALGGAYALRTYLQQQPAPPAAPAAIQYLPLAALDMKPGRMIRLGDIALANMATYGKPVPPMAMLNPDQIVGRILAEEIKSGDPFLTTKLYPEGSGPNVAERLKPGMRAITIPVMDLAALGGYVQPGVLVDVIFKSNAQPGRAGYEDIPEKTVTLLTGLEVLAVGPSPVAPQPTGRDRAPTTPTTTPVTLAARPEQANTLRTVIGHGELTLALRGTGDQSEYIVEGKTLEDILGIAKLPPPVVPPPEKPVVQRVLVPFTTDIYRAGRRSINVFSGGQLIKELHEVGYEPGPNVPGSRPEQEGSQPDQGAVLPPSSSGKSDSPVLPPSPGATPSAPAPGSSDSRPAPNPD